MSLPTLHRVTIIDAVKAALMTIDGDPANWRLDVARIGIQPVMKDLSEISPDECPFVVVIGGASARDDSISANMGQVAESFVVTVWIVVKPDEDRFPRLTSFEIREQTIGDVLRAIEASAYSIGCHFMREHSIDVQDDPLGSYSFVQFNLTYALKRARGI